MVLFILSIFSDHGIEASDFFGLRHYTGAHIPSSVDVFLAFGQMGVTWILCKRVIVDRFIRRRPAKDG